MYNQDIDQGLINLIMRLWFCDSLGRGRRQCVMNNLLQRWIWEFAVRPLRIVTGRNKVAAADWSILFRAYDWLGADQSRSSMMVPKILCGRNIFAAEAEVAHEWIGCSTKFSLTLSDRPFELINRHRLPK